MAADNVYQELKTALEDFEKFLSDNEGKTKLAIPPLRALIGDRLNKLFDTLIDLLKKIEAEITKLDVSAIPGLAEVATFSQKIKGLLDAAKKLLPAEAAAIDEVSSAADIVAGLPSLDTVKADIIKALDSIVTVLGDLEKA